MKLTRLSLDQFTVFDKAATVDFAPGVNLFIGENGTGKSHVLKLVYALTEATRRHASGQGLEGGTDASLDSLVRSMLLGVFKPDALESFTPATGRQATLSLEWEEARLDVTLGPGNALTARATGNITAIGRPLFVPPREVLSIFPGFVATWLQRESELDRTYFDLCVALGLKPLKAGVPAALLAPIEKELDASVVVKNGRFYLAYAEADMELPMVAEGDRKLAMLAYLLMNGSIAPNGYLIWDEPEANLNPKRAKLMGSTAAALANAGTQIFLATHDYALAYEIALTVDTGALPKGAAAFFALYRKVKRAPSGKWQGEEGVFVERGERLAELQHNAILDTFADLHDREENAMLAPQQAEG